MHHTITYPIRIHQTITGQLNFTWCIALFFILPYPPCSLVHPSIPTLPYFLSSPSFHPFIYCSHTLQPPLSIYSYLYTQPYAFLPSSLHSLSPYIHRLSHITLHPHYCSQYNLIEGCLCVDVFVCEYVPAWVLVCVHVFLWVCVCAWMTFHPHGDCP